MLHQTKGRTDGEELKGRDGMKDRRTRVRRDGEKDKDKGRGISWEGRNGKGWKDEKM